MQDKIRDYLTGIEKDLIEFTQTIIRVKSITQHEGELAELIKNKMIELDYDDVTIDDMGNVIGTIGCGETKIIYDSHIDTVREGNAAEWTVDPFSGELKDGKIFGRGSVDMKSAVAATIYAGHAIKKLGLDRDKTIYISTSVMEEDFDGEALAYICRENGLKPDYAIICEPSSLKLAIGHRGRSLIKITTNGISSHGSAPEKGLNAVYEMTTISERVKKLQEKFSKIESEHGSIALTKIESEAVSLNAVPSKCSIYLDRRLVVGEDETHIEEEVNQLIDGIDATWEIYNEIGESWTGKEVTLRSFLPAWEIEPTHGLVQGAIETLNRIGEKSQELIKWDFCTNGVTTAGKLGIPTVGIGPGNPKMAHMVDEYCEVSEIKKAFQFYTLLPSKLT